MKILQAERLTHGRSESWRVTFSEPINDRNQAEMIKLLQSLSWLWQTTITTISPDTIIYEGWTD